MTEENLPLKSQGQFGLDSCPDRVPPTEVLRFRLAVDLTSGRTDLKHPNKCRIR